MIDSGINYCIERWFSGVFKNPRGVRTPSDGKRNNTGISPRGRPILGAVKYIRNKVKNHSL